MTTYRAIAPSERDANSPIKQQLIVALEKNPRAVCEGDGTAPNFLAAAVEPNTIPGSALSNFTIIVSSLANSTIVEENLESDIGSGGAVGQGQIRIAAALFTTTVKWNSTTGNGAAIVLANGMYLLGWRTYTYVGTTNYAFKVGYYPYRNNEMGANFDQWTTWLWHGVDPTTAGTSLLWPYYVNASPPYRLPGIGHDAEGQDVRRFIFLDLDTDGKIISSAWLEDPPWHDPRRFPGTRHYDDGRITWRRPALPCDWREALGDPGKIAAYLAALRSGEGEEIELTAEAKCSPTAMDSRSHPFGNPTGTVRLLDPGSAIVDDLCDLMDAGAPLDELLANLRPKGVPPAGLREPKGAPLIRADWR